MPKWLTYSKSATGKAQIPLDSMRLEVEAEDGTYWFAGFGGFLNLDPVKHTYESFQLPGQSPYSQVNVLALDNDGSLWLAPGETETPLLYHFKPTEAEGSDERWRVYGHEDEFPQRELVASPFDTIGAIAFSADGTT